MQNRTLPHTQELVINWHMTEVCNYACKYCYAKWDVPRRKDEISQDGNQTLALLADLSAFFIRQPRQAQKILGQTWGGVRLNFAGGEPLLYTKEFLYALRLAESLGFKTSIITNGTGFTPESMQSIAPRLSWLGISLDSASPARNRLIGRETRNGLQLSLQEIIEITALARTINPALKIKINTVVNGVNHDENMNSFVAAIAPDKWKILKMLPVIGNELTVTHAQFKMFVRRHNTHKAIISAEDNASMTNSYLMIDPLGRFYQNSGSGGSGGYTYSNPVHLSGTLQALSEIPFSVNGFLSRYTNGEEA